MRRLVLLLVSLGLLSTGAYADYAAGLRAYQAKDYAAALAEWQPLADQGDANSQYRLGLLYARGEAVGQDYEKAAAWYRKAADQGLAAAQTTLGVLYAYGRGLARNNEEAVTAYQTAADQGNATAQNFLGYHYRKGIGIAQDYSKAEVWFSLSGPGTNQQDANARADVAAHLTPEQMAQALRLAQEWRTNRAAERATVAKPSAQKLSCPQPAAAAACKEFHAIGGGSRQIDPALVGAYLIRMLS